MKYCVMANLRLETPAKRDTLHNDVKARIGGKKVWGDTITGKSQDEEGYPSHNLVVRFDNEADMDDLYEFIKSKLNQIPVLKGTVSKHPCYHDESPAKPCIISEKVVK